MWTFASIRLVLITGQHIFNGKINSGNLVIFKFSDFQFDLKDNFVNTVVTPGLLQKKCQESVTVRAFFRF